MKNKERAFFNGYTIVIILCLLFKIICLFIPSINFLFWNRIVAAATVSTGFFCIADAIEQYNDNIKLLRAKLNMLTVRHRYNAEITLGLIENSLNKIENFNDKEAKGERLLNRVSTLLEEEPNNNFSYHNSIYYCNILGFIVFIAVLIFDKVYQIIVPYQDIITVFAFSIVHLSIGYKEYKTANIKKEIDIMMECVDRTELVNALMQIYDLKEEKNNGKAKDENV